MGDGNGKPSRTEALNQAVRAICVIALLVCFCFAYVIGVLKDRPIVDNAAYIGILTLALTWFFKSRDEQQVRKDQQAQPPTVAPPGPGGPTP